MPDSRDGDAQCVEWLRRLVAFDTVSRNSNLGLIEDVRDALSRSGFSTRLVANRERTKASLIARLGPAVDGGVVLSGHTDVVPVDGQAWVTDPFKLAERDGRLIGRGTVDMKGFIAASLAVGASLGDVPLHRPLILTLSYDEEVGCLAAADLVESLARDRLHPAMVLVGEPTDLQIAVAHKGVRAMCTSVRGRAFHSSMPNRGVNAIQDAMHLIAGLESIGAELARAPEAGFPSEPPFTTVSVNRIEGGTAVNIVPAECRFQWDLRYVPSTDADQVLQRWSDRTRAMRLTDRPIDAATEILFSIPAFRTTGPAAARVGALLRGAGERVVPFATEAGFFQSRGWSTVVCGPGSIDQAHQPNEFITRDQLRACLDFLSLLTAELR